MFEPPTGPDPILDARATTHVVNRPNALRNLTGSADITLTVRGPVTNMTIGLDSDPPYDRQQILGLLLSIPAIGGTSLFNTPGQTPIVTSGTGGLSVGQEAFGILNAQFTRNLLAPLETNLGGALGLQNLNFTLDYTGAVGISARKLLGKNIYAVYATTFGYPYRQTFGFEVRRPTRPSPRSSRSTRRSARSICCSRSSRFELVDQPDHGGTADHGPERLHLHAAADFR